jgi:thiamine-phosphate pyrophosphorylase
MLAGSQLMLIVSARDPFPAIETAVHGGVTALELREKDMPTDRLLEVGRDLQAFCARVGIPLLVNDRPDVCLVLGAAGVHVGPDDLSPAVARKVVGRDRMLGVSVRTRGRLSLAENAFADYIGVGALRSTSTKPDTAVIGLGGIEAICRETSIPVLAIGDVQPDDVPALLMIGVSGVAVSSGILGAPDPGAAAGAYREALSRT